MSEEQERMPTKKEADYFLNPTEKTDLWGVPPDSTSWSFYFDASARFRSHYEALAGWYKARGTALHYCNTSIDHGVDRHYLVLVGTSEAIQLASAHIKEPVPKPDWKKRLRAWRSRSPGIYY